MLSFDVVSEVNMHEVTNAVDQANRVRGLTGVTATLYVGLVARLWLTPGRNCPGAFAPESVGTDTSQISYYSSYS